MQALVHIMLALVALFASSAHALYGGRGSAVVEATDKTFKNEVLQHPGVVIVEFYAPWCGHCKSLAPEYEKAASHLHGVVKVVAVDATEGGQSLAQKFGVQGFPTLKIFGADKKKPTDYNGQRTSDAIVSECMRAANQLVKDRKKGKTASSGGGAKSGGGGAKSGGSKPAGGSGSGGGGSKGSSGGSAVVELTELNFNALVLESNDHWLVEFYAPWCGHCKNLAPEWEQAAKQLKGSVKLGAVDATVHGSLAQQYGVKGYPTIKLFPAGKKSAKSAQDYNGPREASGIVEHALRTLDAAGVPPNIPQLTGKGVFDESCAGDAAKICVVLFVPHIYDSSAKQRQAYVDTLGEVAKGLRGAPFSFMWSEAGAQADLEKALDVNFNYPTVAVLSAGKKVYAVQRVSWSLKNVKTFLNGIISGSERTSALPNKEVPALAKVAAWDGKDAKPPVDEVPLADLMD